MIASAQRLPNEAANAQTAESAERQASAGSARSAFAPALREAAP